MIDFDRYLICSQAGGLALTLLASSAAFAQHVWFDPRLELKLGVSDNSELTEADRRFDGVLNVSPGLNTRIEGHRLQAAIDYSYDYLYFLSDGGDEGRHNLFGTLDAEVIDDHFNITSRGSLRQVFLDRGGAFSNSIVNRTTNRRLVQTYTAKGTAKGGFRDFADWLASYRFGLTLSPADDLTDDTISARFSDTTTHEFAASIGSGDRFNNLEWRISGSSQKSLRSLDVNDYENERVAGELTLKFNRHFQLLGAYGVTRNSFELEELSADGSFWDAGFRWTPGPKLDVTVKAGEEGVRQTWFGRLQYFFGLRLDLLATYTDTLTSNSIVLADNLQSFQFNDQQGIIDGQGLPIDESDPNFSLTDVDFRRQNANAVLTWRHKRSQVYVSGNMEWRTFDDGSGMASTWGVSSGFDHKINEHTDLTGTISYRQSRFEDSIRVDNYYVANLDWSRTLSRDFTFSVQYSHTQRQSNEQGADLMENALTLYLRGTF